MRRHGSSCAARATVLACAAWATLASFAGAQEPADPLPYRIEQVADGVFAALQPGARRFDDSNATIIVTDRDVVVIDAQSSPAAVRSLIAEIGRRTALPVAFVVNTHWHGDHTFGNQAYRAAFPNVEVIGHTTLAEDLEKRALPQLAEEIAAWDEAIPAAEARLAEGVDRAGAPLDEAGRADLARRIEAARARLAEKRTIEPVPPTLTVDRALEIHRGARVIRLMHFTAHTRGDLVAYLPAEKVLVTGDLLDALPFGGHGYPRAWITTLETLDALEFDVLVPGHGPVYRGAAAKAQLRLVLDLLRTVVEQVSRLVEDGADLDKIQAAVDLGRFRPLLAGDDAIAERNYEAFIPALVERAFEEASGTLD